MKVARQNAIKLRLRFGIMLLVAVETNGFVWNRFNLLRGGGQILKSAEVGVEESLVRQGAMFKDCDPLFTWPLYTWRVRRSRQLTRCD